MDIKDFKGLAKFKLLIPGIYILSWIGMIFGPSCFPYVYDKLMIISVIYGTMHILTFFVVMVKVTI